MIINKVICPEDVLRIILPAEQIPDRATVSRPTARRELTYTLRKDLTFYAPFASERKNHTVKGFFLMDAGDFLQIEGTDEITWHVTAEDLVEALQKSWNTESGT